MGRRRIARRTKDFAEMFATPAYYGLNTVTIPLAVLYGLGAASNSQNLVKFFVYGITALPAVMAVMARILMDAQGYFDGKDELMGFRFFTIHSPEETWAGKRWKWIQSPLALFSASLIFGAMFGALVRFSGQFFAGIPIFEVEGSVVSGTSSLILSWMPAVSSETLLVHVFLQPLALAAVLYVLIENDFSKKAGLFIAHVFSVAVGTVSFLVLHQLRYSGSEADLFSVFLLGFIDSVAWALTHSIIPVVMIHGPGNFFHRAAGTATSAAILSPELSAVIVMASMLVGGVGLWWYFISGGR